MADLGRHNGIADQVSADAASLAIADDDILTHERDESRADDERQADHIAAAVQGNFQEDNRGRRFSGYMYNGEQWTPDGAGWAYQAAPLLITEAQFDAETRSLGNELLVQCDLQRGYSDELLGVVGHLDIAICSGSFVGWVGRKGAVDLGDVQIEIRCGEWALSPVPVVVPRPDLARAGINGRGFRVSSADGAVSPGSEVSLCAIAGSRRTTLATTVVAAELGRVDWIDSSGRVQGWAVCCDEWPAAVEVLIAGRRVCTALADGYYPELAGGRPRFVGFAARMPVTRLRRPHNHDALVSLRLLRTGATLFTATLGSIPIRHEVIPRGRLPVDTVVKREFDAVCDDDLVNEFYRNRGAEAFVEVAYCYILERLSDPDGFSNFVWQLEKEVTTARAILWAMYHSDERVSNGPFLGPFVGDADYPFAAPIGRANGR